MEYTRRARVFVGTACNVRCGFCYYVLSGSKSVRPTEDIKKQIDIAKRAGMEAVDFSGGEPTMIKGIVELVKYAKDKGFDTICTLTNGQKMANEKFADDLVGAGLNDVLFSVHGHSPDEHDSITQINGSFDRLMKATVNVKDLGIPFRVNCTVSRINYKNLTRHAKLYVKLKPIQVNFILFNDWETSKGVADVFCVKYSEAAPYIKKAIEILKNKIRYINVRYIPFCFMDDYEKYVTNYPQKIYDPFEWSQKLLMKLASESVLTPRQYYRQLAKGFFKCHPKPKLSFSEYVEDICVALRRTTFVKPNQCQKCMYSQICDGLEQSYMRINGANELKTKVGARIKDPLYFRKDVYNGYSYNND